MTDWQFFLPSMAKIKLQYEVDVKGRLFLLSTRSKLKVLHDDFHPAALFCSKKSVQHVQKTSSIFLPNFKIPFPVIDGKFHFTEQGTTDKPIQLNSALCRNVVKIHCSEIHLSKYKAAYFNLI